MNVDPIIIKSSELDKTTKLFLHSIASFCDPSGECYPSQKTLAEYMSTSVRTVQRCLRLCIELGLISVRRRWRRSNIYKVKCLVKQKLSTIATRMSQENKPPKNYKNVSTKNALKVPKQEWKLCFQDSEEVLGKEVTQRNRGWLSVLIQKAGVDLYLESLRWLKSTVLMSEAEGNPVYSPPALQTWYLRKNGVQV
jgi:DNA-binding transcriptional MocR family regulator